MTEEAPVERRIRLQAVLLAWQAFLSSPAYPFFKNAQEEEVRLTQQAIVMLDPVDRVTEIESLKLRGDLRTEEQFVNYFEDTATRLQTTIDDLVEAEQPSSEKQETEE